MFQNGLESVLVSWTPGPTSVTGYYISYKQQGDTQGEGDPIIRAESNDTYNITIHELVVGATYTINVSANSTMLPSTPVTKHITLGMPFLKP